MRASKTQRENENSFLLSLKSVFNYALHSSQVDQRLKPFSHVQLTRSTSKFDPTPIILQETYASHLSTSSHEYYPSPPQKIKKMKRKKILSVSLSTMLDRTMTSNRKATFILAAASAALDQDLSIINFSKDTVRRTHRKHRAEITKYIKDSFKPDIPLTES